MRLKILFDHQIFQIQRYGGISKYFSNLIYFFLKNPDFGIDPVINFTKTKNIHFQELNLNSREIQQIYFQKKSISTFKGTALKDKIDLVHFTFYRNKYLKLAKDIKSVSTIHDLIPEKSSNFSPTRYLHYSKKKYIETSNGLIAVSKNTLNELDEFYRIKSLKTVVYLGVDAKFKVETKKLENLPNQLILFVGNRGGYKNFSFLCSVIAQYSCFNNLYIGIFGGGDLSLKEKGFLKNLHLLDKTLYFSDEKYLLQTVYASATALVFPSEHEGFGLPPLEALACGTPVIVSNNSIFKEILGDHAFYFESNQPESLRDSLRTVIDSHSQWKRLKSEGISHAVKDQYSWEKTAINTALFYRKIISVS